MTRLEERAIKGLDYVKETDDGYDTIDVFYPQKK